MTAEKTGQKERPKAPANPPAVRGRPFAKGVSGNPTGRPIGALNRSSRVAAALFEGEAEAIGRKAVALALGGDVQAIRLILERLLPPAKERPVTVYLPELATVADLPGMVAKLLALVAAGELLPGEAEKLAGLLGAWRESVELVELESRIAALEGR